MGTHCTKMDDYDDPPRMRKGNEPVSLHIYDLGRFNAQVVNKVLRPLGTGMFHCAVEVYGAEWSYGSSSECEETGVFSCRPRECPGHVFTETVPLGLTPLCCGEVMAVIAIMQEVWYGSRYSMLTQNCYHFADDLCRRLLVQGIPHWVEHLPLTLTSLAARSKACCHGSCGEEKHSRGFPQQAQRTPWSRKPAPRGEVAEPKGLVQDLEVDNSFDLREVLQKVQDSPRTPRGQSPLRTPRRNSRASSQEPPRTPRTPRGQEPPRTPRGQEPPRTPRGQESPRTPRGQAAPNTPR